MLSKDELKKIRKIFDSKQEYILTNYFKVLGDANRHNIFLLLNTQVKMATSDIAEALKISLPLASQHLKTLEQVKLLKKVKVGQRKFYFLDRQNSFVKMITKKT